MGTAARPGIDHAPLAASRSGIAAGPGRRKFRTWRPATVDPQSRSRTRHRAQHGCGRFRAARGRRVYRAPTRLRLFCGDAAHRACRFNVGHRKRSGGTLHLAPCEIPPFGYARLAQVAASLRDGLSGGRRSPDRKLETARIARPVSAQTAQLGLRRPPGRTGPAAGDRRISRGGTRRPLPARTDRRDLRYAARAKPRRAHPD